MVRFDQNKIVFEDEDNIDQYRVELLNTGELEIEYLPSGDMWKFENDGTLDADSLNVANYNDSAIDHDKTSNRTHDGDDLSPATLEAGDSFTDPAGNTYTGKVGLSEEQAQEQAIAADFVGL